MIIKEFLPNPAGKDQDGEYILLLNDSEAQVSLAGWSVKDAAGKTYKLSGSLAPNEELLLHARQTKIVLNNNGETVFLLNEKGVTVDSLSYSGTAQEDMVVTRTLTAELREKLFDDLAGKHVPVVAPTESAWLIGALVAAVVAGLSVWIYSNITKPKYDIEEA